MGKIIAITNQKGGVGKTTTAVNLTASLAVTGHRVLLIDLDPQGNATMGCGIDKHQLPLSSCDLLLDDADPQGAVVHIKTVGFDLIPANRELTAAEVELLDHAQREQRLRMVLALLKDSYEYVFVDCPPSLNMLTLNALVAADSVLIPLQCEYYALEGLSDLMQTLRDLRQRANTQLQLEGVLRTMYDARSRLAKDVSDQLTAFFPNRLYRTFIPRNIRLAEAPSHGQPIHLYDRNSAGALAYLALAGELLERNRATGPFFNDGFEFPCPTRNVG